MIVIGRPAKDAGAHKAYGVSWADWLAARGYVAADIVSLAWSVPAPLVKTHEAVSGADAIVWVSGGAAGAEYDLVCTVEMPPPAGGQPNVTDRRTLRLRVL